MAPEVPEPPHAPHHGSSLPRWLEWTTAISALVISICSIGIAVYNASIESRLLKANSYPYLVSAFNDGALSGPDLLSVELMNRGMGPADERSLRLKLGGRYVTDVQALIRAAVSPAEADKVVRLLVGVHDNEATRFIAAKDQVVVFQITKTPQNAREWDLLDKGLTSQGLEIEFCYCSVFEQCWTVTGTVHTPVKACVRDPAHEFTPKPRYAASPLPPA
ncbi:MAG TPA: hypothetical protein VFE18_12565 [Phenylobacterium sp.]|jgi:hypothetical protein|uniref:hypothetical protein n=1 Tax=Phenylobacterium sp. TaxID=1871053 RepID=UPI002D644028|nr:hypothetical protein [Phenylobacterium sp.]HZZ68998.1 hypothetical protein [Phenylobacterium sp.]